ncbi:uncharacterized protein LOC122722391 [Manihot esculenta]|uniref:uncharacterized protein LOC122722391 n=1 Tax=Manihot esculenta TaxID=3983 RepID=UPI001CC4A070|nr:uncharacterized protein LOC122722391 [Manihot esculenta]
MIENEEADNYSAETTRWTRSEAEEEEYRLEKKPRPEDEDVDQKLQKLREQLLVELGKKDQSQTFLPTSSPFSKQPWERRDQRPFPPRTSEQRPLPSWVPEKPTPLNASRAKVLVAVQDKEFLQWPKPLKAEADQRNPDKYCQFHRTHGHDTNNCFQLIAEIERLIKRGHLKNFVKKPEGQRPQPNPAAQTPRRTGANTVNDGSSGTINMIVGGTGGRMSRRGKKRSREGETSNAEVMQIVEHSSTTITFSSEDAQGVQMPHDDALVIEAVIHNYWVKKILVDDGSKVNLLPYRVFQQMGIPKEQLVRDQAPIKGIGGAPVTVEGKVKLALTLGEAPRARTHYTVFLVAKLPLSYNAILGRPVLFDFEAVTSIRYLAMKFPTEAGVATVRGSQEEVRAVYLATVAEPSSAEEKMDSEVLEVRDEKTEARTESVGELETFSLSETEIDKTFSLNAGLTKEQKAEVMSLIRGRASSFAWKPSDMPRIDPGISEY